mmetsp:Transcript_39236/g.59857  ORF Transcript_39236/g.59857 Transcript_39236/m.59857 type:complete len:109 (-) Transcript_39236:20-346(-)
MRGLLYNEALDKGLLKQGPPPTEEELAEMRELLTPKKLDFLGLRFPEKHAGDPKADYLRLSFQEEDAKWMEEQRRKTLTLVEQKKMPREVLTDNWDEDMSMYKHKRKE